MGSLHELRFNSIESMNDLHEAVKRCRLITLRYKNKVKEGINLIPTYPSEKELTNLDALIETSLKRWEAGIVRLGFIPRKSWKVESRFPGFEFVLDFSTEREKETFALESQFK